MDHLVGTVLASGSLIRSTSRNKTVAEAQWNAQFSHLSFESLLVPKKDERHELSPIVVLQIIHFLPLVSPGIILSQLCQDQSNA